MIEMETRLKWSKLLEEIGAPQVKHGSYQEWMRWLRWFGKKPSIWRKEMLLQVDTIFLNHMDRLR